MALKPTSSAAQSRTSGRSLNQIKLVVSKAYNVGATIEGVPCVYPVAATLRPIDWIGEHHIVRSNQPSHRCDLVGSAAEWDLRDCDGFSSMDSIVNDSQVVERWHVRKLPRLCIATYAPFATLDSFPTIEPN